MALSFFTLTHNGQAIKLVNVAESTGGRWQDLSFSPAIFISPKEAKHGAVFAPIGTG